MKEIKNYNKACNDLAKRWIIDYFDIPKDECDYTWIGGGSILEFADYYIGIEDILTCYKEKIPSEVFFKWYEYRLEEENKINLKSFFWGAEKTLKKEEESLQESKNNLTFAKDELFKLLTRTEEQFHNNV